MILCSRMDGTEKRKVNQNECCGAFHHILKKSTNFARLSWDKYFTAQISLKQLFDYSDSSKRNIWLLRFLKNFYLATFFTSWHYLSHWHPIWRCENCFIELCNKVQLLCYPLFVAFEMSHLSYHLCVILFVICAIHLALNIVSLVIYVKAFALQGQ